MFRKERRDTSPAGAWNRKQFETSAAALRVLRLSPRALEHCLRLARRTGRLPHELVSEIIEEAILDRRRADKAGEESLLFPVERRQ